MIHTIGYACICLGLPDHSIARSVRLANATPDRLRQLIRANLTDLQAILAYNVRYELGLFRLNQSIIPLLSHPQNTLTWWADDEFRPLFRLCGKYILDHGLRVSMHPGQYTVLNSANPDVVARAIAEIVASCRVLDSLGVDASHKIVIHGGAGSPDHASALTRFTDNWPAIPASARERLVLENDERIFSIAELLPLCQRLQIPLIFDWLHHQANPGGWQHRSVAEILPEVFQTWRSVDGIPKVHYSSQASGRRLGAHAYDLDPDDFRRFADALGAQTVDVMAECKGKDLAVRALREALGMDCTLP